MFTPYDERLAKSHRYWQCRLKYLVRNPGFPSSPFSILSQAILRSHLPIPSGNSLQHQSKTFVTFSPWHLAKLFSSLGSCHIPAILCVLNLTSRRCTPGGIGHALALEFHRQGLRVLATARTVSKIADLVDMGIECFPLVVDNHDSVEECFRLVSELLGSSGLDYLINNAGKGEHLH